MTNKEAIAILGNQKIQGKSFYSQRLALDLAIKALEENEGLRLLIDWAVERGFGYDNIPEEYEKYKEEISDMGYTEGLVYIARKEAKND